MRLRNIALAGVILLALAFITDTAMADTNGTQANLTDDYPDANASSDTLLEDDIAPAEGLIGPEHALYGLMIAFGNLGTTFVFDPNERLGIQVSQARQRIAEAKAELRKNNLKGAEKALEKYEQEMDEANATISRISDTKELLNAQIVIVKHQYVLWGLLNSTPNSTGLQRAYNNSVNLEKKFIRAKTHQKFVRHVSKGGREVLKQEIEENEDDEDKTQVKAEITGNGSKVKIKVRFVTDSTNETDIAEDIVTELQHLRNNLSQSLRLEEDDETEDDDASVDVTGTSTTTLTTGSRKLSSREYKKELKAEARVEENDTEVKVEYTFHLDAKDRDGIINGIDKKLSDLTPDMVLGALKIEVKEKERKVTEKKAEKSRKEESNSRKGREDSEEDDD